MTLEGQYAQALYELIEQDASKSQKYLVNLQKLLEKKGHQKLLPRILFEYELNLRRRERIKRYSTTTPEQERTDMLLELYRKLVTS